MTRARTFCAFDFKNDYPKKSRVFQDPGVWASLRRSHVIRVAASQGDAIHTEASLSHAELQKKKKKKENVMHTARPRTATPVAIKCVDTDELPRNAMIETVEYVTSMQKCAVQ